MIGVLVLVGLVALIQAGSPDWRVKRGANDCNRCQSADDYLNKNFDRSNWMYQNKDKLSGKRLVDLKAVGTHHSASYTINQILDAYSVCQNSHVTSQLNSGVRYIDLRVGAYLNKLMIGHSVHFGADVGPILDEIVAWVKAHPKEFLIVNLRDSDWTTVPPQMKFQLINLVRSKFAGLAVTSDDKWWDLSSVTLGNIWQNNRSVYIIYGDKLLWTVDQGNGPANVSQSQSDSWGLWAIQNVYDPWPNTFKIDDMFSDLDGFYDRRPQPRNNIYVSQLILTAAPLSTPTVDKLTQGLQQSKRIHQWLNEHPDHAIVYVDFFAGVTDAERSDALVLVDEVINSNFQ